MIQAIIAFSLNNRFLILLATILLLVWGGISFHNLPVEAYPDVANNYVQVITQWPGRAAEEVEQQVTVPLEIVMNGIPHLDSLRSVSIFGLSSIMMIFDDESVNDANRQKVLERLSQVSLPNNLQPVIGSDWSPVGQIYFYTLKSTNPSIDLMDLKSLEDWVLEKQFRSVPNVVDVSSFGGTTRANTRCGSIPDKLIALRPQHRPGGAAATAWNNVNAGDAAFSKTGSAADQCPRGRPHDECSGHRQYSHQDAERHAHPRARYRHYHAGPEDPSRTAGQSHSPGGRKSGR